MERMPEAELGLNPNRRQLGGGAALSTTDGVDGKGF